MTRAARVMRIAKNADASQSITIDGEALPFYVSGEPLAITVDPRTFMTTVYLGVLVERVVIDADGRSS